MLFRDKLKLFKKLCGAFFVFAFFAFPIAVSARTTSGDAPPPGNATVSQPSVSSGGWRSSMLSERTISRRHEGLDIRGIIPVISESFESADMLNNHIDNIISSLTSEARRLRARAITFSYAPHTTDYIVSLVIYAEVATTLPHTLVRSVNFSRADGRLVSMNEATGIEIVPLAERILAERIRNNPEYYYAALSSQLANQAFYLTDNSLYILFDGFRLSSGIGDVETIEIILSNINTFVLEADGYRHDGPYGLEMIPLRALLEGQLGFDVAWDGFDGHVTIRRNGVDLIELRNNDNEYIVFGSQRRSLEAAPQIIDDVMYVPITFFDQILPFTTFSIDYNGRITFISYLVD